MESIDMLLTQIRNCQEVPASAHAAFVETALIAIHEALSELENRMRSAELAIEWHDRNALEPK
jgi:hypothetical protein